MQEFKGRCMGVRLAPRSASDPHIAVTLLVEDDEIWHERETFSSYWLDELIAQLQMARAFAVTQDPDMTGPDLGYDPPRQFGWKFKSRRA